MPQKIVGRLRHRDFSRICSQSPAEQTRGYRLYTRPTPAGQNPEGRTRLGLSVSRRIGKAVRRNLVRRRLKAAFGANAALAEGADVIIVAKPGIERFPFGVLCRQLEGSLRLAKARDRDRARRRNS